MSEQQNTVRQMQQWRDGAAPTATPLAGYARANAILEEMPLIGCLTLRGDASDPVFQSGVEQALGLAPAGRLQSISKGETRISWISPDEWLIHLPIEQCFAAERKLRDTLLGRFAVVNTSGGQTTISLRGTNAIDVLKKSTPYDVRPGNFPVGKAVTSTLAKTHAVFIRLGDEEWHIVVRRSFAHYAWDWLSDAANEYLT